MEGREGSVGGRRGRLGLHAGLAVAAVLGPALLAALDPPILAHSYGKRTVVFELFAFAAALALAAGATLEIRARRGRPARELLPAALPALVGLYYALLLGEYPRKPFDYDCYEYAARALLLGQDPYRVGLNYLYPPLAAEVLALAHRALAAGAAAAGFAPDPEAVWEGVFYLYQCAQLALILLAYGLLARFARESGISPTHAALLAAALLLFDDACLRTLRHGQVNLWLLDLSLVAVLFARRAPALAGLALAVAVHLKLYPALLVLPLAAFGGGRALAFGAAGVVGVVALQTEGFRDWTTWRQFAEFYASVYPGEIAFRNQSFHSLAFNTLRLAFGVPAASFRPALRLASSAASAAALAWLLARTLARARRGRPASADAGAAGTPSRQLLGGGADALGLSLLVSQSVWEHHYVLALPLVVWAAALRGRERPAAVAAAAFLAVAMPTADLFPLSYHRAAGLVALLLLTSPRHAPTRDDAASARPYPTAPNSPSP
jgi:hypothetical protein